MYVVLTAQRVEVFGVVIKLPEFTSSIQGAPFGHSGQHGHTEAPVATNVRLINFQKLRGFAKDAGNLFIVHGPNYEPDQFPSAQRLARNLVSRFLQHHFGIVSKLPFISGQLLRCASEPLSDRCRASGRVTPERTIASMRAPSALLEALGGEGGCRGLSAAFYARVGKDPVLRPFFPGKSLKCATEEFAAFLIQFLGGDEKQTQHRWWLSLRESHGRFQIGPTARRAWLRHMKATLDAAPLDDATRNALRDFFSRSSAYVIGRDAAASDHEELAARWSEQRVLDSVIAAIVEGRDDETLAFAPGFASRPSVFVGLLARMVQSGRARLIHFVIDAAESDPSLATRRFAGTTLLHFAAGAGCLEVVALLLRLGADPNIQGRGDHTPLYCVANECASETGREVVRALVRAGADVNACGGVTRATALHMAARRGHVEIARALLDSGAAVNARDRKGDTPLQRAINCRKKGVSQLLLERGPAGTVRPTSHSRPRD